MSDIDENSNSDNENSDNENSDNEKTKVAFKNTNSSRKYIFKGNNIINEPADDADNDSVENAEDDDDVGVDEDENEIEDEGDTDADDTDADDTEADDTEADDTEADDTDINNIKGGAKNEEGEIIENPKLKSKPKKTTQLIINNDDDSDDDDDNYEENYLKKFDKDVNKNYINEFHPECLNHNSDEVSKLSKVYRDNNNIIIDGLHKTLPYLTKYEKARILGQRAKQIETGSKPLVRIPENIIDANIIAELELREKKIPFIIKRPIPNGAFEYWNLKDLEIIIF